MYQSVQLLDGKAAGMSRLQFAIAPQSLADALVVVRQHTGKRIQKAGRKLGALLLGQLECQLFQFLDCYGHGPEYSPGR
jgi:hypothetical protein